MADKELVRIRETSLAYAEAVRATQRYFERVDDIVDPAVQIEYASLVEGEKRAAEDRLDAIEAAGFEVPSLDESDPDH
jgi:hypothetical protein